jgi:hypothetical protein
MSELVVDVRAERGTVARIAGVQGIHRARPNTVREQDAGFGYLVASVVDALRAGRTDGLPDGIRQAARFAQEEASGRSVSDETFEAARAAFGDRGVVELAIVVGYYLMLSTLARTFIVEDGAGASAAAAPAAAGRGA